ncbi:unnamed protein product [Paramecium sonneborni]|uniref:Uncharacterized protein n=1 Tax=Paramecium sonneborni TaxID=65129 RepID=A0A8S1PCI0_9CILI|nr:unnamed protein product [Paramecium sonneborni]
MVTSNRVKTLSFLLKDPNMQLILRRLFQQPDKIFNKLQKFSIINYYQIKQNLIYDTLAFFQLNIFRYRSMKRLS